MKIWGEEIGNRRLVHHTHEGEVGKKAEGKRSSQCFVAPRRISGVLHREKKIVDRRIRRGKATLRQGPLFRGGMRVKSSADCEQARCLGDHVRPTDPLPLRDSFLVSYSEVFMTLWRFGVWTSLLLM